MSALSGAIARYSLTKDAEDKTHVKLHPERSLEVSKGMPDRIPPMSIVVHSTYPYPEAPGLGALGAT